MFTHRLKRIMMFQHQEAYEEPDSMEQVHFMYTGHVCLAIPRNLLLVPPKVVMGVPGDTILLLY